MTTRIGINGFGRIGRSILRAQRKDPLFADLAIVAINDPMPPETARHLLHYDSVHGNFPAQVNTTGHGLEIDGEPISYFGAGVPEAIPWQAARVDYVVEASGRFIQPDAVRGHLQGGARRVVLTAPANGEMRTLVMGINESEYDPRYDRIVSNASCSTNCLAHTAKVLLDHFGLEHGMITTVHAYTADQSLLDRPHADLRRARAAGVSMIPTKTGAAAAIGRVLPALKGRLDGLAVRVPTPDVSLMDLVAQVKRPCSVEEVHAAYRASANRYLGYSDQPLVSVDYVGNTHSAVYDADTTRVIGNTVKVMSWYDNEWGYANRVLDLLRYMVARELA
ncbi:MAG: type I glyceraldehyde-3-phosphate dehydrogenase [Magnetococcales bacterium]|nr:type I glyceraldehyde-3-phosphate dehydrogenase [Magnetococcales bacterium]